MPGELQDRQVSPQDKALAADWLKRIEAALRRYKDVFDTFETNRKRLAGIDPATGKKMRANLHFANMAMMLPQTYAKDPEYAAQPTKGVPPEQLMAVRKFGETAEAVLTEGLVKKCELKRKAKRLLRATYATSVGWWKLVWQEDVTRDPLIIERISDTQDNIRRLQQQRDKLEDPQACTNTDLELAKLRETLAGLEGQAEVTAARGLALDFVLSEDVIVVDESIRELGDYKRSAAIGHRVWMTKDQYKETFGYEPKAAKMYREQSGSSHIQQAQSGDNGCLLCVWEVWDKKTNRVLTVCDGEEGFCKPPFSPEWTGKRWYPFFGAFWNEIDGRFYPLSDIELTHELVKEYNQTREDFARDREACLPFSVARKGGSLTHDDIERIKNRKGSDIIMVEGVGGQPLSNDLQGVTLGAVDPKNYDTAPARQDMEQIVGGGDAARGSVLNAKTATEAEILSQGLRSRSAERQDTIEDLLSDLGQYALEVMLRKMTPEEVARIAGPESAWPTLSIEQVFDQLTIEVRGGSTGKPDRLQEQDRWTKLLPVIQEAMGRVAELRQQGQEAEAQAVISLVRETLRRFEERLDIEQFLPPPKQDGQPDPNQLMQENQQLQMQMQELQQALQAAEQGQQVEQQKIAAQDMDSQRKTEAQMQQAELKINAEQQTAVEIARIKAQVDLELERERLASAERVAIETARIKAESAERQAQMQAAMKAEEAERQAALQPEEPEEEDMSSQQVIDGMQTLLDTMQEMRQSIEQNMQKVASAATAPRKRIPIRDPETGDIVEVQDVSTFKE